MCWGLAVLCASATAAGSDESAECAVPAAQASQWAAKYSLALQGCTAAETGAPPSAAHRAAELALYDGSAERTLTPVPAAAPLSLPPRAARARADTQRVLQIAPQVQRVAQAYDIDPLLLHAIAHVESRHNPQAESHAGAIGLMQVMPATARRFGIADPGSALRDPATSLEVSSAYLKTLQARFGNNLALVLAAYNAGEGSVERHGRRVPPYAETQGYVQQVLAEYRKLRAAFGSVASK
jgi:soluble lytic murein transglycosylase-like protein